MESIMKQMMEDRIPRFGECKTLWKHQKHCPMCKELFATKKYTQCMCDSCEQKYRSVSEEHAISRVLMKARACVHHSI